MQFNASRHDTMVSVNPTVVLRNYIAQSVIDDAEAGRFGSVQRLLAVLERPYQDHDVEATRRSLLADSVKPPTSTSTAISSSKAVVSSLAPAGHASVVASGGLGCGSGGDTACAETGDVFSLIARGYRPPPTAAKLKVT